MKRLILCAALVLATFASANAQFGVIGGWTSSKAHIDGNWKPDVKSMSLYHVGVAYKIKIGPLLAVQPELSYQLKGGNLKGDALNLSSRGGFVELGLGMQLGLDLLLVRPFFVFQPFLGYQVYGNEDVSTPFYYALIDNPNGPSEVSYGSKELTLAKNKFEGGFGIGGGLELMNHFQITVQWFKNIGQLYDGNKVDATVFEWSGIKDIKNYSGVKITLGMFF